MAAILAVALAAATAFAPSARPAAFHHVPANVATARRTTVPCAVVTELDTLEQFDEVLETTPGIMVVDYATSWCLPCQELAPGYERLATIYDDYKFFKVMGDRSDETKKIMAERDIQEVPSFHIFKDGERRAVVTGAKLSTSDIIAAIEDVRWSK